MIKQVRGHSAAVLPELSKTKEVPRVIGNLGSQSELPTQPHVPVNVVVPSRLWSGVGIDYKGGSVKVGYTRVAVVTALGPGDLADSTCLDGLIRLPNTGVRRRLRPHLQHSVETPNGVPNLNGLI